jgi:hypothetical protein
MVQFAEAPVEMYADLIRRGVPFAQANYGDGEWSCILGRAGKNVNGEVYNPELAAALTETLVDHGGMWCGTNPGRKLEAEVDAWIERKKVAPRWVWKETLSGANVDGKLAPVFQALRHRHVILVGPEHLRALPAAVVEVAAFIPVPDSTAWRTADQVVRRLWWLGSEIGGILVVLFAAGMGSNLMIHRLWKTHSDRVILLDVGAILDPYVGVWSRKGYRKRTFHEHSMWANVQPEPGT